MLLIGVNWWGGERERERERASALITETSSSNRTSVKEDYYSFIPSSTLKMKAESPAESFVTIKLHNAKSQKRVRAYVS
jgi:hypothetical protein